MLDPRRTKSDGKCPVKIRVTYKRSRWYYPTGKDLTPEEWGRIAMASSSLCSAPIYLDDTASITVPEMKARLRRMKDLGFVVVDYLQLMQSAKKTDNRVQEVSDIPRSLKKGCCARINKADVRTPALFQLMQKTGNISEHDMFNTFNMGVGMVLTVPAEQADKALDILHANGEPEAYRLGIIAEGEGVELC